MFSVSQECLDLGLRSCAIVGHDVRVAESSDSLDAEIAELAVEVQHRYSKPSDIRSDSRVQASADVLRRVGIQPKKQPPTFEALLKRLLKQGTLPRINTLVDAYNCVSARHRCSLGAHDLDRLAVPVELRMLRDTDKFIPLGGEEPVAVSDTEFGYVDAEQRVICWLDLRQAEFSKVTPTSSRVLIIVEATAEHPPEALPEAVADLIATLEKHCGGRYELVDTV